MPTRTALFLLLMFAAVVAVSAQSLGELAKQEEARRKAIRTPGKVYTDETIRKDSRGSSPGAASSAPVAAQPAAAPSASGNAPTGTTPGQPPGSAPVAADPKQDEASWRKRIQSERDLLQRAQVFAEALQSRVNALSNDFVARDDPHQRAVIANDRDKALAELERVKQEIQQHTKAITGIQEEARKAGVPAGWVR